MNAHYNLLRTFFNSVAGKELLNDGGQYKFSCSNRNILSTCAGTITDYNIQMNKNSLIRGNMAIDIYFESETGDREIMYHDFLEFDIKIDELV